MSKIPPHATCVFKGVIFDVYQWQQPMFDGSTQTFEMLKRAPTLQVIALQGDDVLYAEEEQPGKGRFLSLFGGSAEPGESLLEAAQRELLEEAGLASDDWAHLRDYPFPGKIDWTVSYFIARDCRIVAAQSLDGGEKIEIRRAPLHDFLTTILPREEFHAGELKNELFSALDSARAAALASEILGRG